MKAKTAVARLVRACLLWNLACLPRPLTVCSPAEDEDAQTEWDIAGDYYASEAKRLAASINQGRVLRLLRDRGRAGDAARKAARLELRRLGENTIGVHAFGPGWRDLGSVGIDAKEATC